MGLLDDYTHEKAFPPHSWKHQDVMGTAMANAYVELSSQGLRMLPETTVTDNWNDLAPDLVIFDNQYLPLSMIDISIHSEVSSIMEKFNELIERFSQSEFFVFDYEESLLYKYDSEGNCWASSDENRLYSKYLKEELVSYFQEKPMSRKLR